MRRNVWGWHMHKQAVAVVVPVSNVVGGPVVYVVAQVTSWVLAYCYFVVHAQLLC